METTLLVQKIQQLPPELQEKAAEFVEQLIQKSQAIRHPKAGFLKGTFEMKADFDEPLDDFEEYM
jgi:hypothetical protein